MSFKRKELNMKMTEMDRETAQIWSKEAAFQDHRTEQFIQNMVEFEGISPIECIIRHRYKVKTLLLKDRKESRLARYSENTLFNY